MSASWLYIAFGISAALMILGIYAIAITQAELASGKREITMIGKAVCLPHKKPWFGLFGAAETDECYLGFLGENGIYYGIDDNKLDKKFWSISQPGERMLISGEITVPAEAFPYTQPSKVYDIDGMIVVTSATSLP